VLDSRLLGRVEIVHEGGRIHHSGILGSGCDADRATAS